MLHGCSQTPGVGRGRKKRERERERERERASEGERGEREDRERERERERERAGIRSLFPMVELSASCLNASCCIVDSRMARIGEQGVRPGFSVQ